MNRLSLPMKFQSDQQIGPIVGTVSGKGGKGVPIFFLSTFLAYYAQDADFEVIRSQDSPDYLMK